MGKKSKRRPGIRAIATNGNIAANGVNVAAATAVPMACNGDLELHRQLRADPNYLPRQRLLYPEDWNISLASAHPFVRPDIQYLCVDAEKYIDKTDGESVVSRKNRAHTIQNYQDCPVCFKDSTLNCSRCGTVSYCSQECQKIHWRQSHKKACKPNPKPYKYEFHLQNLFGNLGDDSFEGHEFLLVKPTEKMDSLQDICDQVIESADDLFDIPGFGADQLNSSWILRKTGNRVYQRMVQKFGFTSGRLGHELVYGYRAAEARIAYFCYCDDCFQSQLDLAPSYYGKALFPPLTPGKFVRGKLVVYKVLMKNKSRRPKQQLGPLGLMIHGTDDDDLTYEFILVPMNKAELAFMLSERCKAMEMGAYTSRMWRYAIRMEERVVEAGRDGTFI
jgi:MYND finger